MIKRYSSFLHDGGFFINSLQKLPLNILSKAKERKWYLCEKKNAKIDLI